MKERDRLEKTCQWIIYIPQFTAWCNVSFILNDSKSFNSLRLSDKVVFYSRRLQKYSTTRLQSTKYICILNFCSSPQKRCTLQKQQFHSFCPIFTWTALTWVYLKKKKLLLHSKKKNSSKTNVSSAYSPNSRPMPDCLYPPNGTPNSTVCAQLTYNRASITHNKQV